MFDWLTKLYTIHLPASPTLIKNPIFLYGVGRDHVGTISKRIRRWLSTYCGIGLAVACLILLLDAQSYGQIFRGNAVQLTTTTEVVILFSLPITFIFSAICDVFYLIIGANGEYIRQSEKRDMLILTGINSDKVVEATYALAQLRAWRICALETGLRVTITILTAVYFVAMSQMRTSNLFFIVLIAPLILFASFYILEPYLRMRRVTARALLDSIEGTGSFLYSGLFISWIATRLSQILTIVALLILIYVGAIISTLILWIGVPTPTNSPLPSFVTVLAVVSGGLELYVITRLIKRWINVAQDHVRLSTLALINVREVGRESAFTEYKRSVADLNLGVDINELGKPNRRTSTENPWRLD